MKKVLTIAGSDCSGGAGIQADIKTITAHKMYAMSVITALTAQNTQGVYGVQDSSPQFVAKQMDSIFTDIVPDAVKIGMVSNAEIIKVIAQKLKQYEAKHIVLDPVMVSTSRCRLISEDAVETLIHTLMPLAEIITPNIPETEVIWGLSVQTEKDMEKAAKDICKKIGVSVLVKGGHLSDNANDCLCCKNEVTWFSSPKIQNPNTHGTGCTLSSAIACNLADGYSLKRSVENAKTYLTGALNAKLNIGHGRGPLNHMYRL